MQLKKLMVSLGLIVSLCTTSNAVAYAETAVPYINDDISLAYEFACDLSSSLEISGKTAYCTSCAFGNGVVSITVTQTLQKHKLLWWGAVDGAEWTETVNYNSIYVSNSVGGLDKGTYRLKSVFTLTDQNGKSETITKYSNEQKVP